MSSFFSALGGTYAQGLLQKKQQDHENDMAQQKQYLDMLNAAANSPAAQSWTGDQWKTYTDAVINFGDVKSQKDPKKSGLGGLMQKISGGAKGGSNLQDKLQQIFGGTSSMPQPSTSSASTPAQGSSPLSTTILPGGVPSAEATFSGSSPASSQPWDESNPLTNPRYAVGPLAGANSTVGPMPESFTPRTGAPPSLQKTTQGLSGPPSAPLTLGGSSPQWHPTQVVADPNTGELIQPYVDLRTGKVMKVPLGGEDPIANRHAADEAAKQARLIAVAQAKVKARSEGNIDEMVKIQMNATPDADPVALKREFSQQYIDTEKAKLQEIQDKHTNIESEINTRAANVQTSYDKLQQEATLASNKLAQDAYKRNLDILTPLNEQTKQLGDKVRDDKQSMLRLANHIPDPVKNPDDTQATKNAQLSALQQTLTGDEQQLNDHLGKVVALHQAAAEEVTQATQSMPALHSRPNTGPPAGPSASASVGGYSLAQRDALYKQALTKQPNLTRAQFEEAFLKAITKKSAPKK